MCRLFDHSQTVNDLFFFFVDLSSNRSFFSMRNMAKKKTHHSKGKETNRSFVLFLLASLSDLELREERDDMKHPRKCPCSRLAGRTGQIDCFFQLSRKKCLEQSTNGESIDRKRNRCKGRGKVSQNWAELECSSSFLVHWSMITEDSPLKMIRLRWTPFSLVDQFVEYLSNQSICWSNRLISSVLTSGSVPLFLFLLQSERLAEKILLQFVLDETNPKIDHLIRSIDSSLQDFLVVIQSMGISLSLHLLIELRLLLFLATHTLFLSWNCFDCCLQEESLFVELSDRNVNLLPQNGDACEDNRKKKSSGVDLRQSVKKKIITRCLSFFDVRGFST